MSFRSTYRARIWPGIVFMIHRAYRDLGYVLALQSWSTEDTETCDMA